MKLALIAMSGIRAENPKLAELGMKLPGFLERAQTLFAMPSLSLITLASLLPSQTEVEYREYREFPSEQPPDCDLAAIMNDREAHPTTVEERISSLAVRPNSILTTPSAARAMWANRTMRRASDA